MSELIWTPWSITLAIAISPKISGTRSFDSTTLLVRRIMQIAPKPANAQTDAFIDPVLRVRCSLEASNSFPSD